MSARGALAALDAAQDERQKVFELQPDVDWNKGKAVRWLLDALALDPASTFSIYIGDDVTDEDAFRELQLLGAVSGCASANPSLIRTQRTSSATARKFSSSCSRCARC